MAHFVNGDLLSYVSSSRNLIFQTTTLRVILPATACKCRITATRGLKRDSIRSDDFQAPAARTVFENILTSGKITV